MDILEVDKNFAKETVDAQGMVYIDAFALDLEGFPWQEEEKAYRRYSMRYESRLSGDLKYLGKMSAGGVVRFRTDSGRIGLKVEYSELCLMGHMPRTGESGFDLYRGSGADMTFVANMVTMQPEEKELEQTVTVKGKMEDYCLFFPLYAGVNTVKIGFESAARVEAPTPHAVEKPFVFYGSSITQGGCASRPANCHAALISRALDAQMVNLGFSGNAKGETYMAELASEIDMSVFILDYDHNAPTPEHLQETHYPFYEIIRKNRPQVPIVMVSGVRTANADTYRRRQVIMESYLKAKNSGDQKVYFVDGMSLFGDIPLDNCTVDLCHPTDLGFHFMAKGIIPTVREALKEAKV